MLWIFYELTKKEEYKNAALWQSHDFYRRIVNKSGTAHHDMGFLYCPSCVAAYRLTGDEISKKAAVLAADNLCERFMPIGNFIQAWGELGAEDNYRLIIDCLINISLPYWASEETGDAHYKDIADKHLKSTMDNVVREDSTTFHTFYFDKKTGKALKGVTSQGISDNSIWARGQAWGILGSALAYGHTKNEELIGKFIKITDAFLSHLPSDNIPAWDMIYTDTETQKDTSAAAIVACGILEMKRHTDIKELEFYLEKADDMLLALYGSCLTDDTNTSNGILKHAVYSLPGNLGVDECNIWGDYFYVEALMRRINPDWKPYWGAIPHFV